jgi:hypothetical protein
MKTIALKPPRPPMNIPRAQPTVVLCSSCDKPLRPTDECPGCSD